MNRKVGAALALVAVVAVAIWFLAFRKSASEDPGSGSAAVRTGSGIAPPPPPAKPVENAGPRGAAPRWALDVDREGDLRLEGQVVGPDGDGVGGADVYLASVPPRQTKTEADGSFEFTKLVGRAYQLSASSNALVGGPVTHRLTATSAPVVIRLVEGASVVVSVVDDEKAPLSDIEVELGDASHRTARTDAKGEATLRPVRPGWVAIQASGAGYAPNTGFATVGSAGGVGRVSITLHKGYPVAGRVVDDNARPIANVRVRVDRGIGANDWVPGGTSAKGLGRGEVVTDAKGAFTLPALATGPHTLSAVDGEHAPGRTNIAVSGGPLAGIEIVMKAGGSIAGTVIEPNGTPVPYATVRIAGAGPQMWTIAGRQAVADKNGAYEVRGLVRTKLQIRAESDTAASALSELDLTTEAEKSNVRLTLDITGTISGTVVDETGAPVPEVQVNALPDFSKNTSALDGLQLAGMASATTDGAGAFTVTGLPDGAYQLWATRAANAQQWGQRGTAAKTGDTGVKITLAAGGTLVGKLVVGADKTPPRRAMVQAGFSAPSAAVDGAFTVKDLQPGTYRVQVRGPEFAERVLEDVKIEPGKTTDLGTIELLQGRKLAGKVVDSAGRPVPNANIRLATMLINAEGAEDQQASFGEAADIRTAVSGADGTFTVIGVPATNTSVMAESSRGRSAAENVPAGSGDPPPVTLTLKLFGSISGRVVRKGEPVSGASVLESTKGAAAQANVVLTDDAGTFRMAKVTEGAHVLQVTRAQMMTSKTTSVTVNVTAGQETKVVVDIPVGQHAIAIEVKAQPGAKLDLAQVFLFAGTVNITDAKQLTDSYFQGGNLGMKFITPNTPTDFDELAPGDYSACSVPITGDLTDPSFTQKLQQHAQLLKVYCLPIKLAAAPLRQPFVQTLPAMQPLP